MSQPVCSGKLTTGFLIFLLLSSVSLTAYAATGRDCQDITKDRIESTLKKMNAPPTEILGIKKSPLEGICEIEVNSNGAAGIFYTDITLNYLIFGTLFDARSLVNLTAGSVQKLQDQKKIDLAKVEVNEKLAIGQQGATKKVIVFSDPD